MNDYHISLIQILRNYLYIGKTMLMDMFYGATEGVIKHRRRFHFHEVYLYKSQPYILYVVDLWWHTRAHSRLSELSYTRVAWQVSNNINPISYLCCAFYFVVMLPRICIKLEVLFDAGHA